MENSIVYKLKYLLLTGRRDIWHYGYWSWVIKRRPSGASRCWWRLWCDSPAGCPWTLPSVTTLPACRLSPEHFRYRRPWMTAASSAFQPYNRKTQTQYIVQVQGKQDHRSLLKAKYCPRVAAASCTQKNTQETHVTLKFDLWPWNSMEF